MNRICLHWPRFGPYHLARLRATAAFLRTRNSDLVGLETAGTDRTNGWRVERAPVDFERVTVFADRVFETIPPREMHEGIVSSLDRLQPDAILIQSYSFPDARACLHWCRTNRKTAIIGTDSQYIDAERIAWREKIKAAIVSAYDAAVVAGTPQVEYLVRLGFEESLIFTGYDVVDNDYFAREAAQVRSEPENTRNLPGLEGDRPFFLAVNRMIPIKNLDRLIRAYGTYRHSATEPWDLVLVGDGTHRKVLERIVATENIAGVVFAGFQQIESLPAYYGRAGAFVHPSLLDTWGLVVNEAMASGLPVLASDRIGCARDLVLEGENGFRFDPADQGRLAELLSRIAADQAAAAAMGRRSEEIIADWNLERFARAVWDAYQAGKDRATRRPFDLLPRGLLWTLRMGARSAKSFHAIDVD
jgi:glycosyltransferase involved in cell wall biosynthesis